MTYEPTKQDLGIARGIVLRASQGRGDSDLESAAMKGLLEAAERWDGSKGMNWTHYARRRIIDRVYDELRRRKLRAERETTVAPEDLPDTAVPDYSIQNTALDEALTTLPPPVELQFRVGHIDQRRRDHKQAIDQLRKAIP